MTSGEKHHFSRSNVKYLGSLNIFNSFIAGERLTDASMQGFLFSSKHGESYWMIYLGGDYIRKI